MHNDYPLAQNINKDMLSRYCSDIADKYRIKTGEVNKLVPNAGNKKNMSSITEIFNCTYHYE